MPALWITASKRPSLLTSSATVLAPAMVERSPETTPSAPAAAASASRLRPSFRPCNTISWPWSIRSRAAMRPRPSDDPVMNTRATSYLLSSRRPLRLTIPIVPPASRVFPCTRHDTGEKVYAIQEEEGRPEKQHLQHWFALKQSSTPPPSRRLMQPQQRACRRYSRRALAPAPLLLACSARSSRGAGQVS